MLFLWWAFEAVVPVRLWCCAMVSALISLLLIAEVPFLTFLISFLPEDIGCPSGMSEWSAESYVCGLKTIWLGLFTRRPIFSALLHVTRPTFLL